MFCSQCGQRVEGLSAKFCAQCGASVEVPREANSARSSTVDSPTSLHPHHGASSGEWQATGHPEVGEAAGGSGFQVGDVTSTRLIKRVGLKLGHLFDLFIKRPLRRSTAHKLLIINLVVASIYLLFALNHLLGLSALGRNLFPHLIEFGLIIASIVFLALSLRMQPGWQKSLQVLAPIVAALLVLGFVQNVIVGLTQTDADQAFLLVVLAAPLNALISFAAYSPALFVWTRTLRGEPIP
jgi:hypothetical protein